MGAKIEMDRRPNNAQEEQKFVPTFGSAKEAYTAKILTAWVCSPNETSQGKSCRTKGEGRGLVIGGGRIALRFESWSEWSHFPPSPTDSTARRGKSVQNPSHSRSLAASRS